VRKHYSPECMEGASCELRFEGFSQFDVMKGV
jgi:hypothetical protein